MPIVSRYGYLRKVGLIDVLSERGCGIYGIVVFIAFVLGSSLAGYLKVFRADQ